MKPLIPILIVATTSLAVASVRFAQQVSAQRDRADAEVQLRLKQDARVAELERNQARLERELAMAREQGATSAAPAAGAGWQRPAGGRPPGQGRFSAAQAESDAPPPPFEMRGGRGPFDSTAGRNYMRTRLKSQVRRLYGDAGQVLGLSTEKSNQLVDLLADQQTRNFGMGRPNIPEGQTPQQYFQDQQKKNADEITALIGADKTEAWASYQKSLPQRSELAQVSDQLSQAGTPMTESQRTQMLTAITEESQRLPRPSLQQGLAPEEARAQVTQWQTEYDKALLDRAKSVLNTDQYNSYKEYQDWQSEMRANLPRGGPRGVATANGVVVGPSVNFTMAVPAGAPPPAQTAAPARK